MLLFDMLDNDPEPCNTEGLHEAKRILQVRPHGPSRA